MKGYAGKFLRVNLSTGENWTDTPDDDILREFIGGRGLAAALMLKELPEDADPLGSENTLYILTGPFAGTPAPNSNRFTIAAKSPLTGIYAYSASGGWMPNSLKKAGYDGIAFSGESETPVYLDVKNDSVRLRDASHIWGATTTDAQLAITSDCPGASVSCIGPAGENLVRIASVISGRRAAGRCGLGAVMGSKKLKAFAVRGTGKVEVHDEKALRDASKKFFKMLDDVGRAKMFQSRGSLHSLDINNRLGMLPTRNYRQGVFEATTDGRLTPDTLYDGYVVKRVGHRSCGKCTMSSSKLSLVRDGEYAATMSEGPEYETSMAFGPMLGITDWPPIIAADAMCDDLGLDTISAGNIIAFAMECAERGLLPDAPRFGDHRGALKLLRDMAFREGIGNMLSNGVREASSQIGKGTEDFAMHVKGLETAGYDPRGSMGMAIVVAAGNRGGCHHAQGSPHAIEIKMGLDRFSTEGKGALTRETADIRILQDSLVICIFTGFDVLDGYAELYHAATGLEMPPVDVFGERVSTVERLLNFREGLTRADDTLPKRFLAEPLEEGPSSGHVVDLEPLLDDYYKVMNWDVKTGLPLRSRMQELGLGWTEEHLWGRVELPP